MNKMLLIFMLFIMSTSAVRAAPPDPGTLGHMKAVLEVCSRFNPQKASQYLLQMKALIGDASKSEVDQAIKTDAYQQEYQTVHAAVSNLTPDGVATACDSYLSSSN